MAAILTRQDKGSTLTTKELDGNLVALNNDIATRALKSSLGTAATKDAQTSLMDTTPGRLMTTGAFGVGAPITLAAAIDLDTVVQPGRYGYVGQPNLKNWPAESTSALFSLDVTSWHNGAQHLLQNSVGERFYRNKPNTSSAWTPWVRIWDSGSLNPSAFLTAETDPTVPAWAKTPSKPSYTKAEVGLGNVDNTSDASKPVSTAQATAIAAKANSNVVITAGTGLTGGGNLSTNRTLAADIASAAQIAAGTVSKLMDAAGAKSQFFNPVAFYKADPYSVAFLKTAANAVSIKAGTYVMVAGSMISFAAQTPVIMPALTAGTDYAIYACADGSIRADASFTAPTGYTTGNSRQIGGFHYAPGGNAPGRAGGDTAPAINQFSLWDLKWRPACIDPRGMTLVANNFWADIYLTGIDHIANGTSKYNVAVARGTTPPKVPLEFGGDGSLAYGSMTWWEAAEVARSHGKQLPTYDQFAALAFGTTEQVSSGGTDVPTTGKTGAGATSAWNVFTSKWGAVQSTGCVWTWGNEFVVNSAVNAGFAFQSETDGRGGVYENGPLSVIAALFGADWGGGSYAGSRASGWFAAPPGTGSGVGVRCVVPHQVLV